MKTDWFPPDVKPVHPGPYEVGYPEGWEPDDWVDGRYRGCAALGGRCAIWNGKDWQHSWAAVTDFDAPLGVQDRPWRGLKEPAK